MEFDSPNKLMIFLTTSVMLMCFLGGRNLVFKYYDELCVL